MLPASTCRGRPVDRYPYTFGHTCPTPSGSPQSQIHPASLQICLLAQAFRFLGLIGLHNGLHPSLLLIPTRVLFLNRLRLALVRVSLKVITSHKFPRTYLRILLLHPFLLAWVILRILFLHRLPLTSVLLFYRLLLAKVLLRVLLLYWICLSRIISLFLRVFLLISELVSRGIYLTSCGYTL